MAEATIINHPQTQERSQIDELPWYSSQTGIYRSKNPDINLPADPFLDVVTHIFSYSANFGSSALIDSSSGHSMPYSQLFPAVKSMASGLQQMGFSQGDVALICLPNSIYFPVAFMSVVYLGGVVTPMNPLSSLSELKHQSGRCRVSVAFADGENVGKLRSLGIRVIQVPETLHPGCEFHRLMYANASRPTQRPRTTQDDTAAILFSSGTTGPSKGVMLTHRNLIATVELFVRFEASQYPLEKSSDNVYLDIVPMYHIYGLALFDLGLISTGTSTIVMKRFDIDEVVKAIEVYKVTHFPVVPPVLAALTAKARGVDDLSGFSSLKQVSCGAASVTPKTIADFVSTFPHVDFIQGYGMTELIVGARGLNVGNSRKYTSVGLLLPNMEARIVDLKNGSSLPPGKAGELLARGPGVMKGYFNNNEATRSTIRDGWLYTGDIAYFDQDGYLYILDRLKEVIKYKGFQISPADLEAVLMKHPEILDVAVAAAADEKAGEIPVAFVVRKPGSMLSRDEVIKYVAKEVAPYKKVRQVMFVNSIPKSPAGKVLRKELIRMLLHPKL